MIRPLVVLRPEPGLSETANAARVIGLAPISSPLFVVEPVEWEVPDPTAFDGILLGSANAVRHSGSGLRRLKGLPVYAVGERTAAAAREGGFRVECVGSGGLQALLDTQAGLLRLLRLAGDERVALDPPAGVTIEERVVYRARPLPLVEPAIDALGAGAVALLHSGNAARRLGEECDRLGIARASVSLAALAPAIAEAAGRGWRVVRSAQTLSDAALLAIASDMCQELGGYAAGEDRD